MGPMSTPRSPRPCTPWRVFFRRRVTSAGAKSRLERSLEIQAKVHGTDEHPSVAASLHELAGVLQAQGDLSRRQKPTRTVARRFRRKCMGPMSTPRSPRPCTPWRVFFRRRVTSAGAKSRLERSLEIQAKVHGTDEHPEVAASLHALAGVLKAQGDLSRRQKPTRTGARD